MKRFRINSFTLAIALILVASGGVQESVGSDSTADADLHRITQKLCLDCHAGDDPEGDVGLDDLNNLATPVALRRLDRVLRVVRSGVMPPEDAEQPSRDQLERFEIALENRLAKLARGGREKQARTGNRRLTVSEYNHTLQRLFGLPAEFSDLLPEDPVSLAGYTTDSEQLSISSIRMEAYVDSARRAVGRYVHFADNQSEAVRYHIEFESLFYSTKDRYGSREKAPQPIDEATFLKRRQSNRTTSPVFTDPLTAKLPGAFSEDEMLRAAIPKLHQQYVAIPKRLTVGECILRVRAAGTPDRSGRFPRMRVEAGHTLGDGCSIDKRVLGEVDVTAPINAPEVYEFRIRAEDIPSKGEMHPEEWFDRLSVFDMDQVFLSNVSPDENAIFDKGRGAYANPQVGSESIAPQIEQMKAAGVNLLHLDCMEIEYLSGVGIENAPYRHQLPASPKGQGPEAETAWAAAILQPFMTAAYRRPVREQEVAIKLDLFEDLRGQNDSPEDAVRESLAAVLLSPSFLFLDPSIPSRWADEIPNAGLYRLASRLSYLLWLEPPDSELLAAAKDGSLARADVLRHHAERLLDDPRHERFLREFCEQWLRLDRLGNVAVDRDAHPTYDKDMERASVEETLRTFIAVFGSDASALDLLSSNYVIVNDRLTQHYGLTASGIGGGFSRVEIENSSPRGGLLGQASLLTMNSDGIDSHPIRRGVWLLERLLHDPPPPPPPNVPDLDDSDPDFRELTLTQKLKRHREPGSCRNCHRKIDPWGLAMENFDAVGRWRESELSNASDRGTNSSVTLPGGVQIADSVELKSFLRDTCAEQFSGALIHHLLTYSLGRTPDFTDREHVETIRLRFIESGFRLRDGVLAMIESPLFIDQILTQGER